MSFKSQLNNMIRTPEEVDASYKEITVTECKKRAKIILDNLKEALKGEAKAGHYTLRNGKKVISTHSVLVKSEPTTSSDLYEIGYGRNYIVCEQIMSNVLIQNTTSNKWKLGGGPKEYTYVFTAGVRDTFVYQTMMNELIKLASEDEICIRLKAKFFQFYPTEFHNFPGTFKEVERDPDNYLDASKRVKIFIFAEIEL